MSLPEVHCSEVYRITSTKNTKKLQQLIKFSGDVKIPSLKPQTFHKILQNHLRGSVIQSVIFADVSQN